MQRVTPHDRDRAVRRMTTATGAITAGSIALTGAFMGLAKHETDERNELKAQQKAAQRAAQQLVVAAKPVTTREEPATHVYTSPAAKADTEATAEGGRTTRTTTKKTSVKPSTKRVPASKRPAPAQKKTGPAVGSKPKSQPKPPKPDAAKPDTAKPKPAEPKQEKPKKAEPKQDPPAVDSSGS